MKTKITFLFLLISLSGFSQAPNWVWARSAGGLVSDYQSTIATDLNNNVYVVGYFQDTIHFGSYSAIDTGSGGSTLDIYLAKYDVNGNVQWAVDAGGHGDDRAFGVATDLNGNVFVVGHFNSSTIAFGSTTLNNSGNYDVFLAKYDTNGNLIWAKTAGAAGPETAYAVATDANNNIIITGQFSSASLSFGSTMLINNGQDDIFLVKYDTNGNVIWAKNTGGAGSELATSVDVDTSGNILVGGSFASDSLVAGNDTLIDSSYPWYCDLLVMKCDSNGTILWAKSASGNNNELVNSIAADQAGNICATGNFYSTNITFGTTTYTNSGTPGNSCDIFLVKYDINGNVMWSKNGSGIPGNYSDFSQSVATDSYGNIFLGGYFQSTTLHFNSTTLNNSNFSIYTIFLVGYNPNGNVLWAKSAGGTNPDIGFSVATDPSNNIYISGMYTSPSIVFGSSTINNCNPVYRDIFLAKVSNMNGIENSKNQTTIFTYPNPSSGKFTIQSENNFSGTIFITNILGELIYSTDNRQPTTEIDLSTQPNGVYFVKVKTEKGTFTQKIVIQK